MNNNNYLALPNRKSVEDAIKVVEGFRDLCRHQLEFGYWATVDFPSKHHLNRLLGLSYRKPQDLAGFYGDGLNRHIEEVLPIVRAYAEFTRPPKETVAPKVKPDFKHQAIPQENDGKMESKDQQNPA